LGRKWYGYIDFVGAPPYLFAKACLRVVGIDECFTHIQQTQQPTHKHFWHTQKNINRNDISQLLTNHNTPAIRRIANSFRKRAVVGVAVSISIFTLCSFLTFFASDVFLAGIIVGVTAAAFIFVSGGRHLHATLLLLPGNSLFHHYVLPRRPDSFWSPIQTQQRLTSARSLLSQAEIIKHTANRIAVLSLLVAGGVITLNVALLLSLDAVSVARMCIAGTTLMHFPGLAIVFPVLRYIQRFENCSIGSRYVRRFNDYCPCLGKACATEEESSFNVISTHYQGAAFTIRNHTATVPAESSRNSRSRRVAAVLPIITIDDDDDDSDRSGEEKTTQQEEDATNGGSFNESSFMSLTHLELDI
jgi:hypothetical protein